MVSFYSKLALILSRNKADLVDQRVISHDKAASLAKSLHCVYMEARYYKRHSDKARANVSFFSARTRKNVDKVFEEVAWAYVHNSANLLMKHVPAKRTSSCNMM